MLSRIAVATVVLLGLADCSSGGHGPADGAVVDAPASTGGAAGNFSDGPGGDEGLVGGTGGTPGPDAAAGGAGGSGSGNPFEGRCGRSDCPANQYCDVCGHPADESGTCRTMPRDCSVTDEPVCTCSGQIFGSECQAAAAGQALSIGCPAPAGRFACGGRFCRQGSEYCRIIDTGLGGYAYLAVCLPLPSGCTDCACLAQVPCGSTCARSGGGDLTVTCPDR
jgi:hypothetical protein